MDLGPGHVPLYIYSMTAGCLCRPERTALTWPPATSAVAALVAVAAGRRVRPGRDRPAWRRAEGTGEEPAVGAGKLADFGIGLGLDAVPEVLLHPSVTERFTRRAPGLSGVARRTLRTNLRFIGRRVVPQLYPADVPLPREHAKAPYSPAEIAGYLALADAQPTLSGGCARAGWSAWGPAPG